MISHPETPTVPRESDLSAADKRVSREETDDVKVVEAEKKSWNRKPLARPIDGQTDSIRAF